MSAEASRLLAQQQTFQDQVRIAALTAAIAVTSESPDTTNHANRAQLARKILMSPQRWAEIMAEGVAVNSTIAAKAAVGEAIPYGDIEFVVNTLFNAYAGTAETEG